MSKNELNTSQTPAEPSANVPAQPASMTNPTNSQPSTPMSKRRKLIIIAGSTVAGLALMAGGVSAYFGYYLPNQPENVIKQALANTLSQSDSFNNAKINGELKVSGENNLSANIKFGLQKDANNGFEFELSSYGVSAKVVSEDGKTIYFKVDGLKQADKLFEKLDGALPVGDYESTIKALLPTLSNISGNWYELDSSLLSGGGGASNLTTAGLTQQQINDLVQAYDDNEFIVYDKKGQTAQVGSAQAVEYIVYIDGQNLLSFAEALKQSESFSSLFSDKDLEQLKNFVNNNDLSKYPFSLWITDNKKIVRFSYQHQYEKLSVELNLTVDKTDKNVKITKPQNPKSVFELLIDAQSLLQNLDDFETGDLPNLESN